MKTAAAQFAVFLSKYTPEIAAQAKRAIAKMRARLPGSVEMVYDNYNALVIGFGPTESASDAVVSLALYPRWITLFFLEGVALSDPLGVLSGSGKYVRQYRLKDPSDLDRPEIRELVAQARARSTSWQKGAKRRMVIKSVSKKQRPRR